MRRSLPSRLLVLSLLALSGVGCDDAGGSKSAPTPTASVSASPLASASSAAIEIDIQPTVSGDATRGKALFSEYQCHRCHDGTEHEPIEPELHCVRCHQDILAGKFKAPQASLDAWVKTVDYVQVVPSLMAANERLRGDWLYGFLQKPHDLRPLLEPSMPRLAIGPEAARHLVSYLTQGATASVPKTLHARDQKLGRQLLETRGCGSCHRFDGVPPLPVEATLTPGDQTAKRAVMLAPDLRHVRERFRPDKLVDWLVDPAAVKPDTLMPATGLSRVEAEQVAAYLLFAPLAAPRQLPAKPRLPVLERKVRYAEVDEKVFRVTCRHCHSNPDIALGEGGPGNTGGFGFEKRGLNLSSYAAINSGLLDAKGQRQSAFAPLSDGTPRIVAAVLARAGEERGHINPEVRGMPLGLPSLSPEQVQILESWVAQGRPR